MTSLSQALKNSWNKAPITWPLKNIIASNPLRGFEDLPFEAAVKKASQYFQKQSLPVEMETINRETIKWLQILSDEGQGTINPFDGEETPYALWLSFAQVDKNLHENNQQKIQWLKDVPLSSKGAIPHCLKALDTSEAQQELFLTLMLTTLPGWSGAVKYQNEWNGLKNPFLSSDDYMAMRLIITTLLWPQATKLLNWHTNESCLPTADAMLHDIRKAEGNNLLEDLTQNSQKPKKAEAQFIFCIDVRSEGLRRAIEASGPYETFGFAGFFAMPIAIDNKLAETKINACPVLFNPSHSVTIDKHDHKVCTRKHLKKKTKRTYKGLTYNFTTPFVLVEALGFFSGLWMTLKSFLPSLPHTFRKKTEHTLDNLNLEQALADLPEKDQLAYAKGTLSTIGLTENFSPTVVICGHGSTNNNNAFASALDCGACGGNPGHMNAILMAAILNQGSTRKHLQKEGISIPSTTTFVGGFHDTTTDQITLYGDTSSQLQVDLQAAQTLSMENRAHATSVKQAYRKSMDWSEIRPEWGLSKNDSFIIGPRSLTENSSLEGRSFLHSYDWSKDPKGEILTNILGGPVIVAQWINSQYLFSTLDNVAYGAGNKVTKNITGRFAIMQGNASDLMHGLPLQSLYEKDGAPYHEPVRLVVTLYAPRTLITKALKNHPALENLLKNQWLFFRCLDPKDEKTYHLNSSLKWILER